MSIWGICCSQGSHVSWRYWLACSFCVLKGDWSRKCCITFLVFEDVVLQYAERMSYNGLDTMAQADSLQSQQTHPPWVTFEAMASLRETALQQMRLLHSDVAYGSCYEVIFRISAHDSVDSQWSWDKGGIAMTKCQHSLLKPALNGHTAVQRKFWWAAPIQLALSIKSRTSSTHSWLESNHRWKKTDYIEPHSYALLRKRQWGRHYQRCLTSSCWRKYKQVANTNSQKCP
jgi:hypothetical protein